MPIFLEKFLNHLTRSFYARYICNNENVHFEFDFDEEIALSIKTMAKECSLSIENEENELVYQLITIRIALELIQCVINSAKEHRIKEEKEAKYELFNRSLWNYSN